jgi:hypothetical protein
MKRVDLAREPVGVRTVLLAVVAHFSSAIKLLETEQGDRYDGTQIIDN